MDPQRRQKLILTGTLLAGIVVLVLVLFLIPVSSQTSLSVAPGEAPTSSSSGSPFPWIILATTVLMLVTIIPVAMRQRRAADDLLDKPKRKNKRKPGYLRDAEGEMLEIIEDDAEENVESAANNSQTLDGEPH